ncbi:MAG: hypothetical protein JF589_13515 [Gemmatimonadetes bacterium]|nr:hypothetical protein [Gemmatimonadota bacterium]
MKRSTRIAAVAASSVAAVLVLLAALPLVFGDRIAQRVQVEVNRNVNARVSWRHAGLSFFRHFPNLSLTLDDLSIAGVGRFQHDTLAAVPHLRVVLDLGSVLRNVTGNATLVVRAVQLDRPRLALITLEDGATNWDIVKKVTPPQQDPGPKPFAVSLKKFGIADAHVLYDDRQSKLKATLAGYDQSLEGDLSQDRVTLASRSSIDTASVTFAGVPYLNRVRVALATEVNADFVAKSYALQNFRSILSLVPAVYAHDFDKVHTSGVIGVDGRVKGEYGDGAFPAFAINAKVNDAAFKYDDLPLAARSIFLDLSLTNPGGSADNTVVKLDRFRLVVGNNPIEARMSMRTPVSDPDVDARVTGRLDLADLKRTVKLEGVDELSGTLAADAAVQTRLSAVQKKQYDKVGASGTLDIANLTVKGKALPHPLAIQKASLALAPQRAQLKSFAGTIGSSDIQASGTLDNLLAFALRGDTLQGTATVRSNHFDLNEWKSDDSELEIIPVPPKLDLTLDATVASLAYGTLKMSDAHGRVRVKNQRATLEGFQVTTLGGQIGVDGFYETTHPDKPTFDVALKLTKVDIPSAFKALVTVQTLAPAARYAAGNVTTDMKLSGALGKNMLPLFASLSGGGTMETSQLAVHDFPVMNKIAEKTKLAFLNDPTLQPLKAAFDIRDGRLFVKPFDAKLGGATMKVSGSNGLDQSLAYTLDLHVPRALAGGAANQAFDGLVQQAGRARVDLAAAPELPFAIKVSGTVTKPQVTADLGGAASSATSAVTTAVQKAADEKVSAAKEKASAEATRMVQEAEQQAANIKQDARTLADTVKAKAYRQADSLVARATNPLLKVAAKPAGDKLRKEADDKAAKLVREADQRADSLVSAAKEKASKLSPK